MTEEQRIERFESAYNRIDHGLGDLINERADKRKHAFSSKVRIAASRYRRIAKHVDFLIEIGELRNAVVHNRTGDDLFLAVPSESTVLELERIEQEILAPERVQKRFIRKVLTLDLNETLAEAFELIRDGGFSRYPVYDDGRFVGLVTSDGFTRWGASQMKGTKIEFDAAKVRIADIIAFDKHRDRATIVSRTAFIDDVEQLFVKNKALEAVIITEHGKEDQMPIGMICPSDLTGR